MTAGDIDPDARASIRRLRIGALILSLLVALSLPVSRWFQETASATAALEAEGDLLVEALSQMATRNPQSWTLQRNLLEETLSRTTERLDGRAARLLGAKEQVLAERGEWKASAPLRITFEVLDSGAPVARLDLQAPIQPILRGVGLMALGGLLLGLLVYLLFSRVALSSILRTLERLHQARLVAEEAGAARSAFLATMSHEIRTPMNGVIGMTSLLASTPLDTAQRHYVEVIRSSGDALLGVINEILEFSKVESGRTELEPVTFQPETLAEDVVVLLGPMAADKGLGIACQVEPDVPAWVVADASRVRQVLINLVGNAVKFTSVGEVVVRLGAPAPGVLCFEVRDTGIGIPADQHGAIFDAFRQGDSSTTRRYGGTGLGLAISRRLAQAMGGDITVASQPGQGSTFTLTVLASATQAPPTEAALPDPSALVGLRVLIVDNQPVNLEILQALCEGWGMEVTPFGSPLQALACVEGGASFDLAALDFNMPEMDGVALARALRGLQPGLPMLLLSSSMATPEPGLFVASLSKPTRRSVLLDTLRRALGARGAVAVTGSAPVLADEPDRHVLDEHDEPDLPPELSQQLRGLRLLVAEDNPVNAMVLQHMLDTMGLSADHVGNGLEAVQAVQQVPYDLVLMDMLMPEMDGLEATRRIRALPLTQQPHIAALTANALSEDRARCLEAGMDGFLSKPLKTEDLHAYLATWARAGRP